MAIKRVHLRTHHGYAFDVKLYNAVTYSHFGCSNWAALCKAYGFQEGMHVTFDLGDPEDDTAEDNVDEDNITIWSMLTCFHFYLYVSFSNIFIK